MTRRTAYAVIDLLDASIAAADELAYVLEGDVSEVYAAAPRIDQLAATLDELHATYESAALVRRQWRAGFDAARWDALWR